LDPEAEVDYGLDPKQEGSLPERLSQAIEAYGLGAVAKAAGISRQHLFRIAKGDAKASPKSRSKLTCAISQLDSSNSQYDARAAKPRLTLSDLQRVVDDHPSAASAGFAVRWIRPVLKWASSTEGWHFHDLRRTGATMLGEMGVEPYVIEAALNHVSIHSQIAATYNVARYRDAVRGALGKLGEKLASLG
jgi:integrase